MAVKISAGEAKRADVFGVDPFKIQVTEELRGRSRPPTEEDIIRLAGSMLKNGQIEPCEVRRIDSEGHVALTLGFTRCAAARLIRTGFEDTEGQKQHDPAFNLLVRVVDCNDQKAFERNIVENAHRNETSPIDDALNHEKLRSRYQYTDADIMRLYGERNTNRIAKYHKLLMLPQVIQDAVHERRFAVDPAVLLLDLPEAERLPAFHAAIGDNGKVSGPSIKAQVRQHHLSDDHRKSHPATDTNGDGDGDDDKKSVPLSMRELRKYFQSVADNESERYMDAEVRFAKDTLAFLSGKRTSKGMDNALRRLFDS